MNLKLKETFLSAGFGETKRKLENSKPKMLRAQNIVKIFRRRVFDASSQSQKEIENGNAEGFKKMKANQLKFQQDDNLPIFLKGGPFDKFLFLSTLALAGLGLVGTFEFVLSRAFPKKIEQKVEPEE